MRPLLMISAAALAFATPAFAQDAMTPATPPAEETAPAAPDTTVLPEDQMAPVAPPDPATPDAMTTTTPAPSGLNAPNGQPADTVTTVASPPVANPTDGQVDAMPEPNPPVLPEPEGEEPEA